MQRLRQLEPVGLPSLRITIFGGEALSLASARLWQSAAPDSTIDTQYGPTEATVACIFQRLTDSPRLNRGRETLAIGRPFAGMQADIIGPQMQFLDAGEMGELALSGPQLALGYLDDPQTAQRFRTLLHPRLRRSRWYLRGDLAMRDDEGRIHWLGRLDNQIKILGHRVELEEIEAHLRSACGTDAVAALPWPVNEGQAEGVVAFVCAPEARLKAAREMLRGRFPPYMVPRAMFALESLRLSSNGKVDREALRAWLQEHEHVAA